MKLPSFGPEIDLDFDNINYYKTSEDSLTDNWDKINKNTYN